MNRSGLVFVAAMLLPAGLSAADPGMKALDNLGRLNGTALHCKFMAEVDIMKKAVIVTAPKLREYGAAFEEGTTRGFLEASRPDYACPPEDEFKGEVKSAIDALTKVFQP